jgi:hypothetical protein
MKKMSNKNISKVLSIFLVLSASVIFQYCQKEDDMPSEKEVFNSNEFIEYLNAGIVFFGSTIEKAIQLSELSQTGPTDKIVILNSVAYRLKIIPYDNLSLINKRMDMQNKYYRLLKKYPKYANFKPTKIKQYILQTYSTPIISNTISLYKTFKLRSPLSRLKGTTDEGSGIEYYGSAWDAFAAAFSFGYSNALEIGGLVFTDGTSMVYYDPYAAQSSCHLADCVTISGGITYYSGKEVASTFHTHFLSPTPSPADGAVQASYFPNCDVIILYDYCDYFYEYYNCNFQ